MKLKFILSDLDGVIRHYPSERNFNIEKKYNLPDGAILKAAFEKNVLHKAVCGKISDEEWRQMIENSLSQITDQQTAKQAMTEWNNFPGIIDQGYLEHLKTQFTNTPVAVLTNGTTRLIKDLTTLGVHNYFFRIFNSAEIGFCKPDIKVFEFILTELKCRADQILFIDDSLSHIDSAKSLGFYTHHYKSLNEFQMAFKPGRAHV